MKLFLDANILFSVFLTDVFITLHQGRACQIVWSTYVEAEAERHVLAQAPDTFARQRRARRFEQMRTFAQQVELAGNGLRVRHSSWESEALLLGLPDPDDVPVAVDAIAVQANTLVTNNVKDFPQATLAPFGIVVMSAEAALIKVCAEQPEKVVTVLDEWLTRNSVKPRTRSDLHSVLLQRQFLILAQRLSNIWEAPPAA